MSGARSAKKFDLEGRSEQTTQHEPNNERVDEEVGRAHSSETESNLGGKMIKIIL